jgi:hypothetical protein
MLAIVANVIAQSNSTFAAGEGQRVYDLLDGLGCIGNAKCYQLGDFTPTTACDYKPGHLRCNDAGLLSYLCDELLLCFTVFNSGVVGDRSRLFLQGLTGTFPSNLNTFSALANLYVLFRGFQFINSLRCRNNSNVYFNDYVRSTLPALPANLRTLYEIVRF